MKKAIARRTPVLDVSDLAGRPLVLKCEPQQPGGAFKIRGATNMLMRLAPDALRRGVITYSSGNHGQAVALAASKLGAPAVIVDSFSLLRNKRQENPRKKHGNIPL